MGKKEIGVHFIWHGCYLVSVRECDGMMHFPTLDYLQIAWRRLLSRENTGRSDEMKGVSNVLEKTTQW